MQQKFSKKQEAEQRQEQREVAPEFGSVEEMIRYDAAHTAPPTHLAQRLRESLALEKPEPWWRRWFAKDKGL